MKSLILVAIAALSVFGSSTRADTLSAFDGDLQWGALLIDGYFAAIGFAAAETQPELSADYEEINVNMPQTYASCFSPNAYVNYHVNSWYENVNSLSPIFTSVATPVFEGNQMHGAGHDILGCGFGRYCVWAKVRLHDGSQWVEVLPWAEDSILGTIHPFYQ